MMFSSCVRRSFIIQVWPEEYFKGTAGFQGSARGLRCGMPYFPVVWPKGHPKGIPYLTDGMVRGYSRYNKEARADSKA